MNNSTPCAYITLGFDGSEKAYIGEPCRNIRTCRFCGRSYPQVKFSKKAHALSESLGTKYIINNEECDTCNELFSSIEQDFYNRHAFHLMCYDIKGKRGSRKIKTPEISIFNHNGVLTFDQLPLQSYHESKGVGKIDFTFLLKGYPHRPQNIYKCLVKFALSIIDSQYINQFKTTIKWITTDNLNFLTLPKVLFYITEFHEHPRVAYFIRKTSHDKFPYAFGAVEFANLGYFFIIPMGHDEPISGYMIQNFKNAFKQVFNDKDFVEIDLTSTKKTLSRQRIEIDNMVKNQTYYNISLERFLGNDGSGL